MPTTYKAERLIERWVAGFNEKMQAPTIHVDYEGQLRLDQRGRAHSKVIAVRFLSEIIVSLDTPEQIIKILRRKSTIVLTHNIERYQGYGYDFGKWYSTIVSRLPNSTKFVDAVAIFMKITNTAYTNNGLLPPFPLIWEDDNHSIRYINRDFLNNTYKYACILNNRNSLKDFSIPHVIHNIAFFKDDYDITIYTIKHGKIDNFEIKNIAA